MALEEEVVAHSASVDTLIAVVLVVVPPAAAAAVVAGEEVATHALGADCRSLDRHCLS